MHNREMELFASNIVAVAHPLAIPLEHLQFCCMRTFKSLMQSQFKKITYLVRALYQYKLTRYAEL